MIYGIEVPDWSVKGILLIKGNDHSDLFPAMIRNKLYTGHFRSRHPEKLL